MALTPLIVALWQHSAARPVALEPPRFSARADDGDRLLRGNRLLDRQRHGAVRRLEPAVAASIAGLLVAYLALFPAFFGVATHALIARYGASGSVLVPMAWTATRVRTPGPVRRISLGAASATARCLGCRWPRWRALSACLACRPSSPPSALRWRGPRIAGDRRGLLAPATAVVVVLLIAVWGSSRVSSGYSDHRRDGPSASASSKATYRRIRSGIRHRRERSSTDTSA